MRSAAIAARSAALSATTMMQNGASARCLITSRLISRTVFQSRFSFRSM